MTRPPLADHQRTAINWIRATGRGLLADEPGLGKSRTAIEAFDGGNVLVVAPAMVVTGGTWTDEIAKWSDHPDRWTVVPYTRLNVRDGRKITDRVKPEYAGPWDAVVVDEAHYTKNRNTYWTRAVKQVSKNADALLLMTGTPMPNWAHELFSLLQLIHPDEARPGARFGSRQRWLTTWFERKSNPFSSAPGAELIGDLLGCTRACPPDGTCPHYVAFVESNLGGRFLRRTRDEVLDLPPLTETQVDTPMNANQRRMYRELKSDYLTATESGEEVIAWTLGARSVMLDKLCTSDCFLSEKTPGGGKLDRLRFDLESRSAPTLVMAHYRETVEACAAVSRETGARVGVVHGGITDTAKADAVTRFKRGELDVLVGSIETLAEGLTLTAADMVIFVEKSFKPSRNEQAMRRVHRIGQTRPVTVLDYVTPDSVDSNKRKLLREKTDQQMKVLSAAEFIGP